MIGNNKFKIINILLLAGNLLISCGRPKNISELDWELAKNGMSREQYEVGVKRGQIQRRTEDLLYIGMPETQFISLFTKSANANNPYIIEHKENQYIFLEFPLKKEKARVTFQDGKLIKFERYGTGSNPWGYADETIILINKHK